jgi:hypothetical protein
VQWEDPVILMLEECSQNFLKGGWETPVYSQSVWSVYWAGLEAFHIPDIRQNTAFVYISDLYTLAILISSELKIINT